MNGSTFLEYTILVALALLTVSFFVTCYRVIVGPTLPDRIVALDMLVAVVIGFIAVIGVKTGYYLYVDIAIALGLVGFLATVAFARFILARGRAERRAEDEAADHVVMVDAGLMKNGASDVASKDRSKA